MRKNLRLKAEDKSNPAKRPPPGKEAEMLELQVASRVTQDNRDTIPWQSRQAWGQICQQEICDSGSPYFLVRFSFEHGEDSVVVFDMDEAGKKKALQAAVPPDTQKKLRKSIDEYDMVDKRGHDVNI